MPHRQRDPGNEVVAVIVMQVCEIMQKSRLWTDMCKLQTCSNSYRAAKEFEDVV